MTLQASKSREGHVYVLTSPVSEYIKIGCTDYAPLKRIKEINSCEPYKSLGSWTLHDNWWRTILHSKYWFSRSCVCNDTSDIYKLHIV